MAALIYLVDDEPLLLEMLSSYLSRARKDWKIQCFSGPSQALKATIETQPDVVISDFSMPEMTGAVMLEQIRLSAPNSIRILVSGYADPKAMGNKLSSAHQYLSKPYSLTDIESKVEKALKSLCHFKNTEIRKTILGLRTLPAMPHIYYELLAALEDPERPTTDVVDILTRDASISAKILQIANSPLFAEKTQSSVIDLLQATAILGTERIKAAVLSLQRFSNYNSIPECFIPQNLSSHRWETANLSFQIADLMELREEQMADAYVAGLMHDMGRLVLLDNFASAYGEACQRAMKEKLPLTRVEQETFKMSQADVISFLVSLWGMRDRISHAILHHERPWEAPNEDVLQTATAVYLAHRKAHQQRASECFEQEPLNKEFLASRNLLHLVENKKF